MYNSDYKHKKSFLAKTITIIVLVWFLFLGIALNSNAQFEDSITVSRNELLKFAEKSILLKQCTANYELIRSDLNVCKITLSETIQLNAKNDSIQLFLEKINQIQQTENIKLLQKKNNWRTVSITIVSIFTPITLIQYFSNKK